VPGPREKLGKVGSPASDTCVFPRKAGEGRFLFLDGERD